MSTPINQQTPGPLHCDARPIYLDHSRGGWLIREDTGIAIAQVVNRGTETPDPRQNGRLFAAAYSMADRAARELAIDAVTLCESIDLSELIRYALDYAQLHTAQHEAQNVGRADQAEACRNWLMRTPLADLLRASVGAANPCRRE